MKLLGILLLLPPIFLGQGLFSAKPDPELVGKIVSCSPKTCEGSLYPDPTRTFSVMVFCDDAMGTTIGIVLTQLGDVGDGEKWGSSKRFWQEEEWCRDVDSFVWSSDGHTLFVATAGIYGTGNTYALNLKEREAVQIFPKKSDTWSHGSCQRTTVEAINEEGVTLIAVDCCEDGEPLIKPEVVKYP